MKMQMKRLLGFLTLLALFSPPHLASAYYDPGVQRWINRDPIGERGGKNLYAFVRNVPLDSWDSYGLSDYTDCVNSCNKDLQNRLHQTCEAAKRLPPYGAGSGALVGGLSRGFLGSGIAGLRPILFGTVAGTVAGAAVGLLAPFATVPVDLGRWMVCVNNCARTYNPDPPWPPSHPDPL
jgi:hypothetical protein